jgi:hypothetical protein
LQIENPGVDFTALVVGPTATKFGSDLPVEGRQQFMDEWLTNGYFTGDLLDPQVHASVVVDLLSGPGRIETMTVAPSPARTTARIVPSAEADPQRYQRS